MASATYLNDDFVQTWNLYRQVMKGKDRDNLMGNSVGHLEGAQKRIQRRQCVLFCKTDQVYSRRVDEGLGLRQDEVQRPAEIRREERAKATEQGTY